VTIGQERKSLTKLAFQTLSSGYELRGHQVPREPLQRGYCGSGLTRAIALFGVRRLIVCDAV
jgi:hypothetical protein